ncbi:hypothetical protein SEA_TANIS_36 [Gordonia phage Tanis]|uniref:Uncharacterized protein n=2 Tax=Tanisvirus tanis TaxID=2844677 RepID=A0A7D5JPX5_9CAUD|nr:hypothetical protein HWC73_gp36 [Gordonia phage Tanis]QFP95610.1 hypothetical protein SEA_TANIS_36 [Gordonia phage Tanis]QKY78708.1 hypothetical protein SEA_GILL_36 [Gordonia phage Gill]QLF83753.1 hypothetical protein SEA_MAGEL_37 [Gordonia phage Magel]
MKIKQKFETAINSARTISLKATKAQETPESDIDARYEALKRFKFLGESGAFEGMEPEEITRVYTSLVEYELSVAGF